MMVSLKSHVLMETLAAASMTAQATSVDLAADGRWQTFGVDAFASQSGGNEWIDNANTLDAGYGSPLAFNFTIGAGQVGTLTVVDANLAGDTFKVFSNGSLLGITSSVPLQQYDSAPDLGNDFDAALANNAFSRAVFTLGSGHYSISGELAQSVMLDGSPLNATGGAVNLSVSAVPEPSGGALAALGVAVLLSRRRVRR